MKNKIGFGLTVAALFMPILVGAQTPSGTPAASIPASTDLNVHVSSQIDNRISGASAASALKIYTDRTATKATRNSSVWTSRSTALNLTGVIGWNDAFFVRGGGALVTPRHFVTATHNKLAVGTKVTFYDASGNPVVRTVTDIRDITGPFLDISVESLDRDVDSTIITYPLVTTTNLQQMLQKYYPQTVDVPVLALNQYGEALIMNMAGIFPNVISYYPYTTSARASFSKPIVVGDSGQPVFIVINNRPVLLATHYTETSGANVGNYLGQINDAISAMGSTYQVTNYNPSFTKNNLVYYPSPANVSITTPPYCLNSANSGTVNVSWQMPEREENFILRYKLSADGAFVTDIPSFRYSYAHSGVSSGSHSYSLVADYGNNLSQPINVSVTVPQLCNPQNVTSASPGYSTPTSTATPHNTPASSPTSYYSSPSTSPSNTATPTSSYTPPVTYNNTPSPASYYTPYYTSAYTSPSNTPTKTASPSSTGTKTATPTSTGFRTPTGTPTRTPTSLAQSGNSNSSNSGSGSSSSGGTGGGILNPVYNGGSISSGGGYPGGTNQSIALQYVRNMTPLQYRNLNVSVGAISRSLKYNDSGQDVLSLQRALNAIGYLIATKGVGSPGNESTYFGLATRRALIAYQTSRQSSGLRASGIYDDATYQFLKEDLARLNAFVGQQGTVRPNSAQPSSGAQQQNNIAPSGTKQNVNPSKAAGTSAGNKTEPSTDELSTIPAPKPVSKIKLFFYNILNFFKFF